MGVNGDLGDPPKKKRRIGYVWYVGKDWLDMVRHLSITVVFLYFAISAKMYQLAEI